MAELNVQSHARGNRGLVRRVKKLSTRVDMTPMVDLGFLLITFFMVSTSWSRPKAMDFRFPANGPPMDAGETVSLTIIPLKDHKVFYYHGSLQNAIQLQQYNTCGFSFDNGIREIIRRKQFALDKNQKLKNGRKEMVVMIKPTTESDFENILKVFDEMLINNVSKYALVDISEEEKRFLYEKKLNGD